MIIHGKTQVRDRLIQFVAEERLDIFLKELKVAIASEDIQLVAAILIVKLKLFFVGVLMPL